MDYIVLFMLVHVTIALCGLIFQHKQTRSFCLIGLRRYLSSVTSHQAGSPSGGHLEIVAVGVFTNKMHLLSPNQQRERTEGICSIITAL